MERNIQFLVFFIVVIYGSYAHQFFFVEGMTSIKPLYFHLFTMGVAVTCIILKPSDSIGNIPSLLMLWLWVFLINSIICFLYSTQSEVAEQALVESFSTTILLFSYLILLQTSNALNIARFALFCVVIFSVIMNGIDFFAPMWTKIPGRAAGLYVNPTISGSMLVVAMVVSIPLVPQKLRLFYCSFVGLGVFITFSRGPWLFWLIAVISLTLSKHIYIGRKWLSIGIAGTVSGFLIYSAFSGGILSLFMSSTFEEYLTPGTFARLGGSGGIFSDYSTTSRINVAYEAWQVFANNPWFGAGLGYDKEWVIGSHNTFLRLAAEGGLFRLSIFLVLLALLWRLTDSIGKVTLLVYIASCFTSHNNLQAPAILIVLAIVALSADRLKKEYSQSELPDQRKLIFSES